MGHFRKALPAGSRTICRYFVTAQVAPVRQGLTGHGAAWVKVSMTPAANDRRPEDYAADISGLLALIAELRVQNLTTHQF